MICLYNQLAHGHNDCPIVEAPRLHCRLLDVHLYFVQDGTVVSLAVLLIDARGRAMVQFVTFVTQTMQGSLVSTSVSLCVMDCTAVVDCSVVLSMYAIYASVRFRLLWSEYG